VELAVARPEQVADLLDRLVQVAAGLPLADPLVARDLVEALALEVEGEQRTVAAPDRRVVGGRVGRSEPPHRVEQDVLERRAALADRPGRHKQLGQRVDLEQRRLVQLAEGVARLRQQARTFHRAPHPP
jgi:hypothetical protein